MTKIQLKRVYSKIFSYNNTDIVEYDSIKDIARALESKYTLTHKGIAGNKIYYNEFIVDTYRTKENNKYIVGNITYYTKNNQVRQLF